jgi:type II secretory pathway component PulL
MHAEIENWQIAVSKQDMIQKSIEILKKPKSENQSIIPYRIEESAQKMLQLFST